MAISSGSKEKTPSAGTGDHEHSDDYRKMLKAVVNSFADKTAGEKVLYSVAADKNALWSIYLSSFPEHDRQHYNCNTCRMFFQRYADLVTIDARGELTSVMFGGGCFGEYAGHFEKLREVIEGGTVEHVHVTDEKRWGIPKTGQWEHFAVTPSPHLVWTHAFKTAYQEQAEKTHDFHTMVRALTEYTAEHLEKAMQILNADVLYRGETVVAPAKWLQEVIAEQAKYKAPRYKNQRHNLLWRAVATAPAGFSHPRSHVFGRVLLEDIKAGVEFKELAGRFKAALDPSQYRRPQSDPGAGNIEQGEKIIAATGAQNSLLRRFATLQDITRHAIWTPKIPLAGTSEGVFAGLKPKEQTKKRSDSLTLPVKAMTVEKFLERVVPVADEIEVRMESRMSFCALVTAADESAPPIIQWDNPDNRNPVSWYVYQQGSAPSQWTLAKVGDFVKVTALTRGPSEWSGTDQFKQHGSRVLFVLENCRDMKYASAGLGIFPEFLKSDFHAIRKTIEAFSQRGQISGIDEATASGVAYSNNDKQKLTVRVRTGTTFQLYELDRWE